MPLLFKRLLKLCIALITLVVLLAIAAVWGVHFVDNYRPEYRQALAEKVGEQLDAQVRIGHIGLGWDGLSPALRLGQIHLTSEQLPIKSLSATSLKVHISWPKLLQGQITPTRITLKNPKVKTTNSAEPLDAQQLLAWADTLLNNDFWQDIQDQLIDIKIINGQLAWPDHGQTLTQVNGINLRLATQGKDAELVVRVNDPNWVKGFQLYGQIHQPFSPTRRARLNVQLEGFKPKALLLASTSGVQPTWSGGETNLQMGLQWHGATLDKAHTQVFIKPIKAADNKELWPSHTVEFTAQPKADQPHIIHTKLTTLKADKQPIEKPSFSTDLDLHKLAVDMRVTHIPASLFSPLVGFIDPAGGHLTGLVERIRLQAEKDQPLHTDVDFADLTIHSQQLHLNHINGHAHYQNHQGRVDLAASNSTLASQFMHGTLPLDKLTAQLEWHHKNAAWHIASKQFLAITGDDEISITGSVTIPQTGAPQADIDGKIVTPDGTKLLSHLPRDPNLPMHGLYHWLSTAVLSGNVVATTYIRGPVDKLFADDSGKYFGITVTGDNFGMEYKPGWPSLTHGRGEVKLRGKRLTIGIEQSQMLGVNVGQIDMLFDDVRTPVLQLHGKVRDGNGNKMLSYLSNSPLKERFGTLVAALDIGGTAGLDLDLVIPIESDLSDMQVHGTIYTQDNQLDLAQLPTPLKHIDGQLTFDDQGLYAENLTGQLWGQNITTQIKPAGHNAIDIDSAVDIRLAAEQPIADLPEAIYELASGKTQAQVHMQLDVQGDIPTFEITSDLKGLALNLPHPLTKPADQPLPTKIAKLSADEYAFTAGDLVQAQLELDGHNLHRAIIGLGAHTTAPPQGAGLWISGQLDHLPLVPWLAVVNQFDTAEAPDQDTLLPLPFLGADLSLGELTLNQQAIKDIQIQAQPNTTNRWQAKISGRDALGSIIWQPQQRQLSADLKRLYITQDNSHPAAKSSNDLTQLDPRLLPSLDVEINRLKINHQLFGRLQLTSQHQDKGWYLDQFKISGGVMQLNASGHWTRNVGLTRAKLAFNVFGDGIGNIIQALGFDSPIQAKSTSAQGVLEVKASDYGLTTDTLNGNLAINLQHGAVTQIDSFASRALGLLNPHMLPRRLELNFRDVFDKGLAFDQITGDFKILNGDSFTDNLKIKIPAADIKITGRTGLSRQDYNQTITISPHVGSSVALASGIFGGPVVGFGVLALSEIFSKPLSQAATKTYRLTGSWQDPKLIDPNEKN